MSERDGRAPDEPAMDQNVSSDEEKIAGIVAQTHSDVGIEGVDRIMSVLAQRFADAHLTVSDERVRELAESMERG